MKRALVASWLGFIPGSARAHATDQGFVLLLPTDFYVSAGVAAVALTVVALFLIPDRAVRAVFSWRAMSPSKGTGGATVTSLASFVVLAALVALGFAGPRDPLSNLMPLVFWTIGWVGVVSLSGFFGNLWRWLNPWMGLYRLIGPDWRQYPVPARWGLWPATGLLVAFTAFLLADVAPDDPARLAGFVAAYWVLTMVGLLIAGPSWLYQVELGHAICRTYGSLCVLSRVNTPSGLGGPGWQLLAATAAPAAGAFALTLLAAGSFDGLNETFWWLARIGVNPLEFPGRSAVIAPTILGLVASLALLATVFLMTVWLGQVLGGREVGFLHAASQLALCLLPIALVYHIAHYLPSFLVSIQYTIAALSDPLNSGADLLGIEPFRVTTGFFNTLDTVRIIWLSQAGLVVLGHVWSVLLSHRITLELYGQGRRASLATLPLSVLMIGYTFLGLWLLASPRGA